MFLKLIGKSNILHLESVWFAVMLHYTIILHYCNITLKTKFRYNTLGVVS